MSRSTKRPYFRDTPLLAEGRIAWGAGEYAKALKVFDRAVKKEPFNLMVLKDAAFAYGQHFETKVAGQYLRRFERLVGEDPGALHVLAETWLNAYRPQEARAILEKAIKSGAARPESLLLLAGMEEKSHRLEEATDLVERILKSSPGSPEGLRLKASLLRRQGSMEDAKALYRDVAQNRTGSSGPIAARAYNEWAQILDREGDFSSAVEMIRLSKKALASLPGISQLRERGRYERDWFQRFVSTLGPNHFEGWSVEPNGNEGRHVILTGCPRSGTTLMEKVLDAHSEIITAEELNALSVFVAPRLISDADEASYSAADLNEIPRSLLRREARNYRRYLESGMGEKIGRRTVIDKIPSNTTMIPFLQRLMPSSQILYALRDPRDIVISSYFCWMEQNTVSVAFNTIETTVERTIDELNSWVKLREMIPGHLWRETRYEDTVDDIEGESRGVLEWMNLPYEAGVADYRNQLGERGVSSPSYEAVNEPVYRRAVERWKNYEKLLEPHLPELEKVISALG